MITNLKLLILITILFLVTFLLYVKFLNIDLIITSQNGKKFNIIPINVTISLILGILILTFFLKKSIRTYLHIFWLLPLLMTFNYYLIGSYTLEKVDYLLGYKTNNFTVNQTIDDNGWIINEIIINRKDTIYYSENPSWINNISSIKKMKECTTSRSLFKKYYHMKIPR